MSECCGSVCRRMMPILIQRGNFPGTWVAATNYKDHDGLLEIVEQHEVVLAPSLQLAIDYTNEHLEQVLAWDVHRKGIGSESVSSGA